MLLILGIIMLVCFMGVAGTIAKRANRPVSLGSKSGTSTKTRGGSRGRAKSGSRTSTGGKSAASGGRSGRSGGARKPSWLLKAWNSTGAPKTSETSWRGASAVLTGKAAGAVTRGGWLVSKKTGKAGAWFASRTLIPFDKWLAKKRAGLENAAALNDTTTPGGNSEPTYADVIHDADPIREPKLDTRTIDDFTAEDLWCTPRGRLALKEHKLKEMTAAFQNLKAAGDVTPEIEAEHMASRRRVEREILSLRRSLNIRTTPEPARTPPPVFVHPKSPAKESRMPFGQEGIPLNFQVPSTLAPHLQHIHDFEPENDAELLTFLSQEVTGMGGYAEAAAQMFETCVNGKGLDPAAMQGLNDYAEAFVEAGATITRAHQQFMAVYEAIIEAAANGTQMPYNGRFFSGESA